MPARELPGNWAAKSAKESREFTKDPRLSREEIRFELPMPKLPKDVVLGKMVPEEGKRFKRT